jgi:hypothetical protein
MKTGLINRLSLHVVGVPDNVPAEDRLRPVGRLPVLEKLKGIALLPLAVMT